ncbi:MAG: 50S ribosomal protein L13 [Oligoflexia bacterium]|nr:50S ribosomal protein L13 [Oligoflexia bacterium]
MSTYFQSKEDAEQNARWYLVDAAGLTVGRLASEIAHIIRGKHKPTFTPHVNCGDCVVVINAEKVKFSGNKLEGKIYFSHSQFPGGLKSVKAGDMLNKHPERVIEHAVHGMLPKGNLGHRMLRNLRVYAGSEHPHGAQKLEVFTPKYVTR